MHVSNSKGVIIDSAEREREREEEREGLRGGSRGDCFLFLREGGRLFLFLREGGRLFFCFSLRSCLLLLCFLSCSS